MSLTDGVTRTVTERVVTLSRRELGSVMSLVDANQAAMVTVREQRIDGSDAGGIAFRYQQVRSYVVTLYGPSSEEYVDPSPEPMQFLLISGPSATGSIDVVQLTRREPETAEVIR